jgi:hypothetical protein
MALSEKRIKLMLAYTDKIIKESTPEQIRDFAAIATFDMLTSYSEDEFLAEIQHMAPELLDTVDA